MTGGTVYADPAQLLAAAVPGASRRVELTRLLLLALLALLLLDIAMRRLGWDAWLEKKLRAPKAAPAKPQAQPAAAVKPAREQPKPAAPAPADTAQALLDRKKNKKLL